MLELWNCVAIETIILPHSNRNFWHKFEVEGFVDEFDVFAALQEDSDFKEDALVGMPASRSTTNVVSTTSRWNPDNSARLSHLLTDVVIDYDDEKLVEAVDCIFKGKPRSQVS